MSAEVIRTPDQLTAEWLGDVLARPVTELSSVERIGTGQMSQTHRVRFVADGRDDSVVVKLASDDPTSRATGVGMGAYLREIAFYRNLASRIGGPLPHCHLAEYDTAEGWFTLVLEDMSAAIQGDQIAGCSVDEARVALRSLARIHAPVLGDLALGTADYLNQPNPLTQEVLAMLLPGFIERYGERIAPEHAEVCRRFIEVLGPWSEQQRPPLGLVHGDYRLDNLLFGDGTCRVVDWQTMTWGPAMLDCSYFIGLSLRVDDRRAHEQELVRTYHDELLAAGVTSLSWEHAWEEYRRQAFYGVLLTVAAAMVVVQTERGDEMFMTSLARNAQQILDLDALSLLPEPSSSPVAPLRPSPSDEATHEPGPEALWNESWYFDAVSDDGSLGVYVRLGRLPNQGISLYTAAICGPGRPAVMLVAPDAPLPAADDEAQAIEREGLRCEQHCDRVLERFTVRASGTAQAYDDESAPLRGEQGTPVSVELDLVWETAGIPYAWRQATRYEIPCHVTGVVRIDGEELQLSGPGQRDHSWGSRDWWAVDWMWSALHLEDGTHIHAVGVPQMPGYGVGYVQREEDIAEVSSLQMNEVILENGLIERADFIVGPGELALEVEPLAFGALRLEAPDGRVSLFPRAMCRVRTNDGRVGSGWAEWNRVQRSA